MKQTRLYKAITPFNVKLALLLLLVALPLSGRERDMAIVPDSNVNLATNIRNVLNAAGGNVTDDCLTFFQERANINKWAKYKPVSFHKDFEITEEEKGKIFYGMSIPQVDPYSLDVKENSMMKYTLPSGGEFSPFRLGDFKGYNTDCIPPFSWSIVSSINLTADFLGSFFLDRDSDLSDMPLNNVMLYDILSTYYYDWYPGVLLYCKTKEDYVWETTSVPLSDQRTGGMEIEIPKYIVMAWDPSDEVYAYGILASYEHHANNSPGGLERGTALYMVSEDSGYRQIELRYENEMDGAIGINNLTLIYNDNGGGNYTITTIELIIYNTSGRVFSSVDIYGYFDNDEGKTFPIRTTSNHYIPNEEARIRIQQPVNVYTADGIINIFLNCSSKYGNDVITSSKYNLKTNTWIK